LWILEVVEVAVCLPLLQVVSAEWIVMIAVSVGLLLVALVGWRLFVAKAAVDLVLLLAALVRVVLIVVVSAQSFLVWAATLMILVEVVASLQQVSVVMMVVRVASFLVFLYLAHPMALLRLPSLHVILVVPLVMCLEVLDSNYPLVVEVAKWLPLVRVVLVVRIATVEVVLVKYLAAWVWILMISGEVAASLPLLLAISVVSAVTMAVVVLSMALLVPVVQALMVAVAMEVLMLQGALVAQSLPWHLAVWAVRIVTFQVVLVGAADRIRGAV